MTVEFKVGDKVRILNAEKISGAEYLGFEDGTETTVVEDFYGGGVNVVDVVNGGEFFLIDGHELEYIELVEPKLTKKQRITVLEETVATLTQQVKDMQAQIDEMLQQSKPSVEKHAYGFEKPGEVTGEIGAERTHVSQLTANEQRKLIIEKAKQFIEKCKSPFGHYRVRSIFFPNYCDCEFILNTEKRTVVALLKGINSGGVHTRGIAKCMPGDVFNEHIGKAIALGRALELDVSEFTEAVQPTEIEVGTTFVRTRDGVTHEVKDGELQIVFELAKLERVKIINDTNAQY